MRKKEIVTVALAIFILCSVIATHIGAEGNESKIARIAEGMEKQNVQINEWSLYSKKNFEKKSVSEVKQMTDQYRQYNWTYEEDKHVFKAIGVFENKAKNVTENLQILTTLTNDYTESYIIYEVVGNGSQVNWSNVTDYFSQQAFDIFQENATIYACVVGSVDDMMKSSLMEMSKNLVTEFKANPIEQLLEQDFLSVSARTPVWEDAIPTANGEMNIQIAMRTDGMGDKTTVVIGTPIITSEY
jgi:IS1 family transposase